jgi:hypothetical protein
VWEREGNSGVPSGLVSQPTDIEAVGLPGNSVTAGPIGRITGSRGPER